MNQYLTAAAIEPTPLRLLERLSEQLGQAIYIKHDDYGPLSWAGSKSRKLRAILDQAKRDRVDTVVMSGPTQSNSCRALAALARPFALDVHLVLHAEKSSMPNGNLKIAEAMAPTIQWAGNVGYPQLERLAEAAVQGLRDQGRRVLLLPPGASSPAGAQAIIEAGGELARQLRQARIDAKSVVHASASGGLHAGLWIASKIHGSPPPISVMIVRDIYDDVEGTYTELVRQSLARVGRSDLMAGYVPALDWSGVGAGYGVVTDTVIEAAETLARTEGLLVDSTYTGKAFAVLLERIRAGETGPFVFWHSGGLPGLF